MATLKKSGSSQMLDVKIVLNDVPDYVFQACGAATQDERDTISACVRTYARDWSIGRINAVFLQVQPL